MSKLVKLDIGGGKYKRDEDYISVDLFGDMDVKATMWALPFLDNSVDFIWSSHTLEHCPRDKVITTLFEWLRVLKPGGRVIIGLPNFDYVARYWLTGPDRNWAEQMVYGEQVTEGEFHRTAFTPQILKLDLEGVGFKVLRSELRWSYNQEHIQTTAMKP